MTAPPKHLKPDRVGQMIRTAKQPTTAISPFTSLLRRAFNGEFWAETIDVRSTTGPEVTMRAGSRVQQPSDGVGPLLQRRYQVTIAVPVRSPQQLIEAFRTDPNQFSPTAFAVFAGIGSDGLTIGSKATVELPGPWDGPITVVTKSDTHVRFETRKGHMEAGWIEFRAADRDGHLLFEIESLARSGDAAFDVVYRKAIGKLVQTEMWVRVLERAVRISGGTQIGRVLVDTIVFDGVDQ